MNRQLMRNALRLAAISSRALQYHPAVREIFAPTDRTPAAAGPSPLGQLLRDGKQVTGLLLGYSGVSSEGRFLTDAMILASFDPESRYVTLISVPRDLWVCFPQHAGGPSRWRKINEAYALGPSAASGQPTWDDHNTGGLLACQAVTEVTGVPIHFWLSLNFRGFIEFINALGGVTINVEKAFDDFRYYPTHDESQVGADSIHIHFDAGPQRMDGDRALMYVRSRFSQQDGSDYARSRRQVRLIGAVKDELLRPGTLLKVPKLFRALKGNLRTSLTVHDARALLEYARKFALSGPRIGVASAGLNPTNTLRAARAPTGQWILVPRMGQGDYREIHEFVEKIYLNPGVYHERTSVNVQDASGRPGLALDIVDTLARQGIVVHAPVQVSTEQQTTIHEYTGGRATATVKTIQEMLGAPLVPALPGAQDVDMVVVVIGKDYRSSDDVTRVGGKA